MPASLQAGAAATPSTAGHPGHAGRRSSPRTSQPPIEKQPSGRATISPPYLLPPMPGLELKLCQAPPPEPAPPRDETASSARLERYKRVEQMYRMALQRRREAASRSFSDEHVAERFLAQEPSSVLAMPSAMPARPPDAVFMNRTHSQPHHTSCGDSAVAPFFLTQVATTTPATSRAQPVARCQSARSNRNARSTPRVSSAPTRPLVPFVLEGDAWRHAEAAAAAAIRAALDRAGSKREAGVARSNPQSSPGCIAQREVAVAGSTTHSPGLIPLSMGSVEWRYPSRSPRPFPGPEMEHPVTMLR
jgi:hypothetical protein